MKYKLILTITAFFSILSFTSNPIFAQASPPTQMPDCIGPSSVSSTTPTTQIVCEGNHSYQCDPLSDGTKMGCCASVTECSRLKQIYSSYPITTYCEERPVSGTCSELKPSLCSVSLPNAQQNLCCQTVALPLCQNYSAIVGGFMNAEYNYEQSQQTNADSSLCLPKIEGVSCRNTPNYQVECHDQSANLNYCCTTERACFSLHPGAIASTTEISQPEGTEYSETSELFKKVNPLIIGRENANGSDQQSDSDLTTPAGIINRLLVFAFPLAGLILFVMIVWGGFKMLMQATSKKSIEDGKKIITNAVIGFMLLFVAYWVMQIIEVIFGIKVL